MAQYIKIPFAQLGDKATIPDIPIGLEVNYTTGYTAAYEADPDTDPTARYVERDGQNQLFFVLSSNIKEWQEHIYPSFITTAENDGAPFPYEKGMIVRYLGLNYISLEANNQDAPPSSKWEVLVIGTAARREVGTAAGEIPDTGILNTRLATTGNLGDAAQRNVGSGLANVPDNTELNTRLATTGNLGDAAQRTVGAAASEIPDNDIIDNRFQSSTTDSAPGKAMLVGAGGLMSSAFLTPNFDSVTKTIFMGSAGSANAPELGKVTNGYHIVSPQSGSTCQFVIVKDSNNAYHRNDFGDWFATGNPPGTRVIFEGDTPPKGYLEENGALVSRSVYYALFGAINIKYGAGDGSTTFQLPTRTDADGVVCIKY